MPPRVEERNELPSNKARGASDEDFLARDVFEFLVPCNVTCQSISSCGEHPMYTLVDASASNEAPKCTKWDTEIDCIFDPAGAVVIFDKSVNVMPGFEWAFDHVIFKRMWRVVPFVTRNPLQLNWAHGEAEDAFGTVFQCWVRADFFDVFPWGHQSAERSLMFMPIKRGFDIVRDLSGMSVQHIAVSRFQ